MVVKQLIEILETCPPEAKVTVTYYKLNWPVSQEAVNAGQYIVLNFDRDSEVCEVEGNRGAA